MSTFTGRGIVLRELDVGESDKIVTLLLKEQGKLTVSARGARKPKSKFMAGTQLFTYSDFVIYDGRAFFSLAQVEVIENFYSIRNDFERLCYACYFLELVDKTVLENVNCDGILKLLIKTLTVLKTGKYENRLASCIFEFKFMQLNGLAPETEGCAVCGDRLEEPVFFGEEGCVCRACYVKERHWAKLSEAGLYALRYILFSEVGDLYKFKVSGQVLRELERAADIYLKTHLGISLKSKTLLDERRL